MIDTDVLVIGAGPVGLFCVHQLGIIGLKCEVVDNLDKRGGQCIELYPDKPIFDIPAIPVCTGEELTNSLIEQIKPFKTNFHLSDRVEEIKKNNNNWFIKTNKGKEFKAPNIIIAGGVGSFEPRKFSVKECEKFEGKEILYSVKDKSIFKDKTVSIFGGGDSALDWAIELSNNSKVQLIHRRDEFRGAESSINKVKQLEKKGKIEILTQYQLNSVEGKNKIENTDFLKPNPSIISNVTAKKEDEVNKIKSLLIDQITSRVRWRESIHYMVKEGVLNFLEIGPGKVLSGLVKKINKDLKISNISSIEDIKND